MLVLDQCPVCGSSDQKTVFSPPSTRRQDDRCWPISECGGCGHQFMNPQPTWDELAPYYNESYDPYDPHHSSQAGDDTDIEEAERTGFFRHIPIPRGKRLLDVGCGAGYFLRVAKKLGAIEQGVEPSKFAAEVASRQGLNVYCGTLEEFASENPQAKFDVITANHVVEHVPNPIETLRTMGSLLAPDGFIWIAVPNGSYPINQAIKGKWHSADVPFHLMQFSPSSIKKVGERAGLKLRRQSTESIPASVANSLGLYFRYKWMVPRRLTENSGLLGPLAKWYAKKLDAGCAGEAILTEFIA